MKAPEHRYLTSNKKLWNERTKVHLTSDFYDNQSFVEGRSSLNAIELQLLPDLKGKSVVHLQCHFGQDTISLARMGAAQVVGLDISDIAIDEARKLAATMGVNASFVCADVYAATEHITQKFDVVFTSYGTIGWLPDLDLWAEQISKLLKPGGILVFVEFHPVIWMFDNDFSYIQYDYFKGEAIVEQNQGTYTDREAPIMLEEISWNHSLSEVMSALITHDLQITAFEEYDYSPYNCFSKTVEVEKGKFMIQGMEGKLPMVYAIKAIKMGGK